LLSLSLVSIFTAMSLSAFAEEQAVKKPAPKTQAIQPKGPAVGSHPPTGTSRPMVGPGQHAIVGSGHPMAGPGGQGVSASRGPHFAHDRSLWGDRERRSWVGGHWRPYECRFGRCGYWWMADGYWYFYDHPMEGPPDVVSDIEYADPSIEQVAAPSPDGEYAPPPPGPPPPPPPGQGAVGGAVGGAVVGGILGGVLTGRPGGAAAGAVIGGATGAAIGARKPSSGMDIICGGASAITDTRPANTPPSTLATAIERRTRERLGKRSNPKDSSRWRASVSPRPTAGSAATAAVAVSMVARVTG
jgi:hypothetical protein